MTPREYGEQRSAVAGFDHLYRFAFATDTERQVVLALRALEYQFDELIEDTSDSSVAMTQAHWWTEEFTRLAAGEPRHPLTKSLALAEAAPLTPEALSDWLCATGVEVEQPVSDNDSMWNERLALRAGTADCLIGRVIGIDSASYLQWQPGYTRARRLARATLLLGKHLRDGYIPVSLERFESAGLEPARALDSSSRDQALEFTRALVTDAKAALSNSLNTATFEQVGRAAPLLATASVLLRRLDSLGEDPGEVLDGEVKLTALRQVWAVRGACRQAKKNAR